MLQILNMELVIFVGLQGCGKTTFYHSFFERTHEHVSKELMRHRQNREAFQFFLVEKALKENRSVVIDDTNITATLRRPFIEIGKRYDARVLGYYFEHPILESFNQNIARSGRARGPDVAIYASAHKLEIPDYEEGFDEIFTVRIVDLRSSARFNAAAMSPQSQDSGEIGEIHDEESAPSSEKAK